MKSLPPAERRRSPRVESCLSLHLTSADFDLAVETKNVSAGGAYCRVDRRLPFMAKLKVALLLPIQEGGKTVSHRIRCEAIVVRSESQIVDKGQERHYAALYFERMKPSDRLHLERYVRAVLAAHPLVSRR